MSQSRPHEVILHYYPGRGGLNLFGHVAIEYNGHYYSFGADAVCAYANADVADWIQAERKIYSGTHLALAVPLATDKTIDLKTLWESQWKPDQYNFGQHNCAHSAVFCLDALGVLAQSDQPALKKLKEDLELRAILRPSEVYAAISPLSLKNLEEKHNQIAATSHLGDLLAVDEDILIDVADGLRAGLKDKAVQPDAALQTLESRLTELTAPDAKAQPTCDTLIQIKMALQAAINAARPVNHGVLTQLQDHLNASYPSAKACIQSLLVEECSLFLQKAGTSVSDKKMRFYADLLQLSAALSQPHCTLDWLSKQIDDLLLQYPGKTIDLNTAANLGLCFTMIHRLSAETKVFDENAFSLQQTQQRLRQRCYDLSAQISLDATLLSDFGGMTLFRLSLTGLNKHFYKVFRENPEANVSESLRAFEVLQACVQEARAASGLFPSNENVFLGKMTQLSEAVENLAEKIPEEKVNANTVIQFATQCMAKIRELKMEATPSTVVPAAKIKKSLNMLGIAEQQKNHDVIKPLHLDWVRYKLFNLLYWYGQSSHKTNFSMLLTLINRLNQVAPTDRLATSGELLRLQRHILEQDWELKIRKYKAAGTAGAVSYLNAHLKDHTFARELGVVLWQVDKMLYADGSGQNRGLQLLQSPYTQTISPGSFLDNDAKASAFFANLCSQIEAMPVSPLATQLRHVAHSLTQFGIGLVITPKEALLELMGEIRHAQLVVSGKEAKQVGKAFESYLKTFEAAATLSVGAGNSLFGKVTVRPDSPASQLSPVSPGGRKSPSSGGGGQ